MKKNLFEASAKDEIIARAMQLTEKSERLWGSLTPAEMLHHCTAVLKGTIATHTSKPGTFKQSLMRFLMLNVIPRFPQGAKTPLQIDIKRSKIVVSDLQTEQQQFAEAMNTFFHFKGTITLTHPYFGNLNRKQWGILTWMHMDHHLRQFGV